MEINKIYNMDCLEGMSLLKDKSIDMILCDLPYGMTACKWDSIIPLDKLWQQYNRIIKDNGAIVLFSAQPFTTKLINSNIKNFKYCWYWKKNITTGFCFAKYQPMRCIEDICVFYKNTPTYKPQGLKKVDNPKVRTRKDEGVYGAALNKQYITKYTNYPKHLLEFSKDKEKLHPTQKPVKLCEYLIKTYTNEGDLVLDNCVGSGSTILACKNTKRNYMGFEINKDYVDIAVNRLTA